MSRENVELVRSLLEAVAAGDRQKTLAFADANCVVDATRNVFNPTSYSGVEGVRQFFAVMDDTWEEMRVDPHEFIEDGDRVAVIGRLIGRGRGSGVEVTRFNGQVWTLGRGRVIRLEVGFTDRESVLEALRLRD